ncbi:histidine kinase [Nakamurella sp. A5-74]|uniref:Histidine kinase n=1 Tax=Nakamurella sp. A5-74 TaxID=3158264 RepID=A0AAU8DTC3_9ACTN
MPEISDHSEVQPQARLRRLNLVMMLPAVVIGGLVAVAVDAHSWGQGAILGLGVVAGVVAFERWTAGQLQRVAPACLLVAAAVWVYGALMAGSTTAFFGIMMVGTLMVPELPRHRALAATGLVAFVAATGLARAMVTPDALSDVLLPYVVLPAGIVAVVAGLMFPNKRFYDVVADLEVARAREAELAVARERIRFASDLHDIQGHTLHVVKLKIALAQKLLHSDIGRVESELREVYTLVGDTINQTKDLAHAQRRLNLSAELENAKNLFEAAGIRVDVDRESVEIDARAGEWLGQVLRETTTNILRHAQATHVRISLSESGIIIVNDGAQETQLPELRGLAALRERVAGNCGEMTVTQGHGKFRTAASFPRAPADTVPSSGRAR